MAEKKAKPKWFERNLRADEDEPEIKPEKALSVPKLTGRPVKWTQEIIENERVALEEWADNPKNYYLGKFCEVRGYTLETLRDLGNLSKSFSQTLLKAKQIQENRLVDNALSKKHDGNFTKFVLANRAGWKERTELSGDVKNPLSFVLSSIDNANKDITIDTNAIVDQTKDE